MSKQKQYFGMYQGIVIQNDDPDFSGKVKVYVPVVSPAVYREWFTVPTNKRFKFIGKNIDSDISDIVQLLRNILPWAKTATPLISEGAAGRYNASSDYGSISDASTKEGFKEGKTESSISAGVGNKPGHAYEFEEHKARDGFFSEESAPNELANRPNPFGANYKPSVYNNAPKGLFGIPSVGAHVWVFFEQGDPNFPVIWGLSHGKSEWNEIYNPQGGAESLDYPGSFENAKEPRGEFTQDLDQYRNKFVLNQKGGTIEIVNSDKRERVNISHSSGSFIELNNIAAVQLCTGNDQKLVESDQYLTVRGYQNNFINRDRDDIVCGDEYVKIGNQNYTAMKEIKAKLASIAEYKQLFDIQRCAAYKEDGLNYTSKMQLQVGVPAPNPVTGVLQTTVNNIFIGDVLPPVTLNGAPIIGCTSSSIDGIALDTQLPSSLAVAPASPTAYPLPGTFVRNPLPTSDSSADGLWAFDAVKEAQIAALYTKHAPKIAELESKLGLGGSQIISITKHKLENVGLVFNDFPSYRVDKAGKAEPTSVQIDTLGTFVDRAPTPLIEAVHVDNLPGGTYDLNVANRYCATVGSGGVHIKTTGGVDVSGGIVNITGTQLNLSSKHEVNIYSEKRVHIEGDVVSLKQKDGKQVVVDSSLGITKNAIVAGSVSVGGETFVQHVTAPVEIQETERMIAFGKTNTAEGAPGAGKRIGTAYIDIVGMADPEGGGFHIVTMDGGLAARAKASTALATAPMALAVTLKVAVYADDCDDDCVMLYPHSHKFKNLPLTLTDSNMSTRHAAMQLNNTDTAQPPEAQSHSKKSIENIPRPVI